jgi:RNA polymerase-interacting CarD/CdnL/TRCF family regulator
MAPKTWTKGDRVVQPTYGAGTIAEYNEHHVVIEFDDGARRTFSTRLVVLQSTNEPAPARAVRKRAPRKKAKKEEPRAEEE